MTGIWLDAPKFPSPNPFTNGGLIQGDYSYNATYNHSRNGLALYTSGSAWNVTNQGTLAGASAAVELGGGYVLNKTNGTIIARKSGVILTAGGTVSNQAGALISGGTVAGYSGAIVQGSGLVTNSGSISGYFGVVIRAGSAVTNAAGGQITGLHYGVFIGQVGYNPPIVSGATTGSLTNAGMIMANGDGAIANGVVLNVAKASVNNTGTIIGYQNMNTGGIFFASKVIGLGVALNYGGLLTNSGRLTGGRAGFSSGGNPQTNAGIITGPATILNSGYITGIRYGVRLFAGGVVTNQSGARISNDYQAPASGAIMSFYTLTAVNAGTIRGQFQAIYSQGTARLTNTGTVNIYGSSGSGYAVDFKGGGFITNAPTGQIAGNAGGIYLGPAGLGLPGTILNSGRITAVRSGMNGLVNSANLIAYPGGGGGLISNAMGGVLSIVGNAAISLGTTATVVNAGTIIDSAVPPCFGITMSGANSVTNTQTGTIKSTGNSVYMQGTLVNYGSISGYGNAANGYGKGFSLGLGVNIGQGGMSNASTGVISATGIGVYVTSGTLTNAGTITGNTGAVKFKAGVAGGQLRVAPGAAFNGLVNGGNAVGAAASTSLILLPGTGGAQGTLSTVGKSIYNFSTVTFAPGSSWIVQGYTSGFCAGQQITGFAAADTIDLVGFPALRESFKGGVLSLTTKSKAVATIAMPDLPTNTLFGLLPDGSALGGVKIMFFSALTASSTELDIAMTLDLQMSIDDAIANWDAMNSGALQTLQINGPGTGVLTGQATVPNVNIPQGNLNMAGGTLKSDPVTIGSAGAIYGYGTVTGSVTNAGTITAAGGTLDLTDAVSGAGSLNVDPGAVLLLQSGAAGGAILVNGGTLAEAGLFTVEAPGAGGLLVENGGAFLSGTSAVSGAQGLDLAAVAGDNGGAVVTGANSVLSNTGTFIIGDLGLGSLSISAGGKATTSANAIIANTAGASGSLVNVSGTGSNLQVAGSLLVGNAGFGQLSLSQGATVSAATLDLAAASGGNGVVSVAGSGTALTLTGSLTVGDQAAGEVSILGGATITALNVTIGNANAASSGNVDVEGTGSSLLIGSGGVLNVGVAGGGSGVLTIGAGTTLHSLAGIVEAGHASFNNNGGVVDPPFVDFTGPSNAGLGSNSYDLYVENIGAVQLIGGTGVWTTPMMLTGTSAADANNNINVNGDAGAWQLISGGTLIVNANTVDSGQAIVFEDATDTLVIGQIVNNGSAGVSGTAPVVSPGAENVMQAGGWAATIWGYVAGDKIQFANMAVSSASVVNGNTVDLFGPGNVALGSLAFFNKAGSKASPSGATAAAAQIPCFVAGTRIATPDGLVAVEDLAVGDRVLNHLGVAKCIVWLGQRSVNCARHPRPETVWPVRVSAGAFGGNVPERDLYLSPDHAVFVNEVLIPVWLLVNGTSITRVERTHVVYYHVELPVHSVILAEGLAVESYLDLGDRTNFRLDGEAIRLFPDFTARIAPDTATVWETSGAVPLVMTGARLEEARRAVRETATGRRQVA